MNSGPNSPPSNLTGTDTETYYRLVAALACIAPDCVTGKIEQHQIVEVLGEIGGIWPASVLDDPARVEIVTAA